MTGGAHPGLVVEVTDCGPGLRGQTLPQLLVEFGGDGGGARAGPIRSSGMGIPICARLAELMGGSIALADRVPGPGVVFSLHLPLDGAAPARFAPLESASPPPRTLFSASPRVLPAPAQAVAAQQEVRAPSAPPGDGPPRDTAALRDVRGMRVLAVDDSAANLRFLEFALRRLGAVPTTATDGDEVVPAVERAAAAGAPFDVCVMDMHMARVSGDAALRALRAAGHALPVVLCTANATLSESGRYRDLGFIDVAGKPFTTEQLHAVLARV